MTKWSTAVWNEDPDPAGRRVARRRVVHAWNPTTRSTACGKPGDGMAVDRGAWDNSMPDHCPDCSRTAR